MRDSKELAKSLVSGSCRDQQGWACYDCDERSGEARKLTYPLWYAEPDGSGKERGWRPTGAAIGCACRQESDESRQVSACCMALAGNECYDLSETC